MHGSSNIKHIKAGNDGSDREMPYESHFAGWPIVARYCMLDGILFSAQGTYWVLIDTARMIHK